MNKTLRYTIIIFLGLSTLAPVYGQTKAEKDLGSWFLFFNQHQLSDPWSVLSEVQHRSYSFGTNFNQLLLRSTLNYKVSDAVSFGAGYGLIPTDSSYEAIEDESLAYEHRIHQQLIMRQKFAGLTWIHRYRLEQRFLEDAQGDYQLAHRARYMARIDFNLNKEWTLSVFDEVFLNLQKPTFSQNRLYLGMGYQATPQLNVQVGFLKNHFNTVHYNRFLITLWYNTSS